MKKIIKTGTVLAMTLSITNIAFANDVAQSRDVAQSILAMLAKFAQSIADVAQSIC